MPLTVSFQYGAGSPISVTFGLTNTKAKAITLRYANRHGLVQTGMTEMQIAEEVIKHLIKLAAQESADTQEHELVEAQMSAIRTTVAAENLLNP